MKKFSRLVVKCRIELQTEYVYLVQKSVDRESQCGKELITRLMKINRFNLYQFN